MIFDFQAKPCIIPSTMFRAQQLLTEYQSMNDHANYWQPILSSAHTVINVNEAISLLIGEHCKEILTNIEEIA